MPNEESLQTQLEEKKSKENYIGNVYNRLTIISEVEKRNSERYFLCRCICGNEKIFRLINLKKNHSKSCGCMKVDSAYNINLTHGESKKTTEYSTWCGIKRRCYNKNEKAYRFYGAKGIKVCDSWLNNFENFLKDMGRKPTKFHTIDRKDPHGDYSPNNCRWATSKEQQNNRSDNVKYIYDGESYNLEELSLKLKIEKTTLYDRISRHGLDKRFLLKPKNYLQQLYEHNGQTKNLKQWSEFFGVPYKTFYNRVKYLGKTIEEAKQINL